MNDQTTFFLAFLSVFGGIAAYLWHLHRCNQRLEARVHALAATNKKQDADEGT